MRVAVFSAKPYDRRFLTEADQEAGHELVFLEPRLSPDTASLAGGCDAVCAFVNDDLSAPVLERLAAIGVRLVALRSAGYNHVDLTAARKLGLAVTRVPGYSPYAVAEHCAGLVLALNRRIHRAYNRVREHNFALNGLLGFDLHGRTVGVIGTGKIGVRFIRIMAGFGCRVLAYDPYPGDEAIAAGARYVPLETLLAESDIVTLHCPLTPETYHLIDERRIAQMRDGVMLINTSRGALIDTAAVLRALKTGRIGHLGLDVYEEEADLFFEDLSDEMPGDDLFSRLVTFPNVLITGHQAFFTEDALRNIAASTVESLTAYARDGSTAGIAPDALVC
ncbi:D-lactate dehydrogenase [Actinoplanes campanulatus]|uniref:D-lactate dehydrogenase n=1 Tax=Actinoplanes campanulatus TaxID=113559 RepID=A0A7W5AIJ6_9ACTN|nr:2-hydroxyacid dehydrogenase [Actinoplanes campanulatus]MBB3096742.1 D-lactate dehydrogenase [Actinoplanes campanulatus]GGN30981.1 lactate dehydrogenase [Actinoplanes campanulatus]GID37285.1 lactate dehydrogenase [Actinoplanes campanulatus]